MLCLSLVSCYKMKHVTGKRTSQRVVSGKEERGREGMGESTGDDSSDLTTWEKPLQGRWSHTDHTSLSTEEFHCLTQPKSQLLPA